MDLGELLPELLQEVGARLDEASLCTLAFTSRSFLNLFRSNIISFHRFSELCWRYGYHNMLEDAVERQGVPVDAFSLWCPREAILHRKRDTLRFLLTLSPDLWVSERRFTLRSQPAFIFSDSTKASPIFCAGEAGDEEAMKILEDSGYYPGELDTPELLLQGAVFGGEIEFFTKHKNLMAKVKDVTILLRKLGMAASRTGRVDVLEFLLRDFYHGRASSASAVYHIETLAYYGHLDLVKKYIESIDARKLAEATRQAIGGGQLHLLKWLVEEKGADVLLHDLVDVAARNSRLEILQYIIPKFNRIQKLVLTDRAADLMQFAAMGGDVDVIKCLLPLAKFDNPDAKMKQDVIMSAVCSTNVDAVKFFHEELGTLSPSFAFSSQLTV